MRTSVWCFSVREGGAASPARTGFSAAKPSRALGEHRPSMGLGPARSQKGKGSLEMGAAGLRPRSWRVCEARAVTVITRDAEQSLFGLLLVSPLLGRLEVLHDLRAAEAGRFPMQDDRDHECRRQIGDIDPRLGAELQYHQMAGTNISR
ncbi:hypothetical protein [Methylorubrum extorquens]